MSLPNLLGQEEEKWAEKTATGIQTALNVLQKTICHKHLEETLCYTASPKCDNIQKQFVVLCKETCFELIDAC